MRLGHIRNAVKLDWHTDVQDPLRRDFVDRAAFEALTRALRHQQRHDGRLLWRQEQLVRRLQLLAFPLLRPPQRPPDERRTREMGGRGPRVHQGGADLRPHRLPPKRPTPASVPSAARSKTPSPAVAPALVDVRSNDEYTGKLTHMVNYPQEGAQRGGHIPGAQNIPWATAANPDGTFKSADELRAIYAGKGITPDHAVITYCRIGERRRTYLVRAHPAARLPRCPQLRRLLDRVGQPGQRPHRQRRQSPVATSPPHPPHLQGEVPG